MTTLPNPKHAPPQDTRSEHLATLLTASDLAGFTQSINTLEGEDLFLAWKAIRQVVDSLEGDPEQVDVVAVKWQRMLDDARRRQESATMAVLALGCVELRLNSSDRTVTLQAVNQASEVTTMALGFYHPVTVEAALLEADALRLAGLDEEFLKRSHESILRYPQPAYARLRARLFETQAFYWLSQDDFVRARHCCDQAWAEVPPYVFDSCWAVVMLNILDIRRAALGEMNDAAALIDACTEALRLSNLYFGRNHIRAGGYCGHLGWHYFERGDLEDAQRWFGEALHIFSKNPDLGNYAITHAYVSRLQADTEYALENYGEATRAATQAVDLYERLGMAESEEHKAALRCRVLARLKSEPERGGVYT